MRPLVLGQVARVRARKVAEAAFVRLLALVEGADVGLQLRVRGRCVPAAVADVRALAGVGALVVVLCLVCGEGLVAACVAACVGSVARVAEQVARELGALLEGRRRWGRRRGRAGLARVATCRRKSRRLRVCYCL